jgi:hypothetical protein
MGARTGTRVAAVGLTGAATLLLLLPVVVAAQDVEPLPGEATTGPGQVEPDSDEPLSVVDVRIDTHDGFDRVTFESEGDGQLGWFVQYEEDPVSDGSGEPIDVRGNIALRVVLTAVALPPDTDADVFLDDLAGPEGNIVNEVVNDSIFEGNHTFVIGLDDQVPYRIGRLSDPNRVVVDLVHDPVPVGPVDAGLGGAATGPTLAVQLGLLGGLLMLAGTVIVLRRRATA